MERELDLLSDALGNRRRLNQLHWGGGTPTYLTPEQCRRLFGAISDRFEITDGAEVALEADPSVTTDEHLAALRELGFNRLSMGVQDVNPEVQEAVARPQPIERTRELVEGARRLGFASINLDLIYGLPQQTEASFRDSVRTVINEFAPDRVACFSYAHVPWIKPHQRQLDEDTMPKGWDKFRIFVGAAEEFAAAGYRFVGFDHFARPDDELALALDEGRLHRNFMGYTVMPASDQIGVGVTAIGDVGRSLRRQQQESRAVPASGGGRPSAGGSGHPSNSRGRAARQRHPPHHLYPQAGLRQGATRTSASTRPTISPTRWPNSRPMVDDGLVEIDEIANSASPPAAASSCATCACRLMRISRFPATSLFSRARCDPPRPPDA